MLCAKRGVDRYIYYVTAMYWKKILRQASREIEDRQVSKVSEPGRLREPIGENN